jgi:hypothetical protein
MHSRDRSHWTILVAVTFLIVAAIAFTGCKEEGAATQQQATHSHDGHDHEHDHPHEAVVQEATAAAQEAGAEVKAQLAVATEQTTCPIMAGNPINKDVFVEYEGKKVYFCCTGCEDKFLADPAQYTAKLPQFKD